jgi:hypothetical protein
MSKVVRSRGLALFLTAYLVYTAARWMLAGELPEAKQHADWILDLERSAGVAIEGSIQDALAYGPPPAGCSATSTSPRSSRSYRER